MNAVMLGNLKRFFYELTPVYYLFLFVIAAAGLLARRKRVMATEVLMLLFAALVVVVFLRTAGWYRYLFEGFIPLLVLFPAAIMAIAAWGGRLVRVPRLAQAAGAVVLCSLIAFQFYESGFHSWVSENYSVTRTTLLTDYFNRFDSSSNSVFFYNVPEAAIFLRSDNYYQYLHITDALMVGQEELPLLAAGVPDVVFLSKADWNNGENALGLGSYRLTVVLGSYVVLERADG
jgi:hypothetical protein